MSLNKFRNYIWRNICWHICCYHVNSAIFVRKGERSNTSQNKSNYQVGRVRISLTGFTPPRFCPCPKPESGFPMLHVVVFVVFSEWRWKMIVCFIAIFGIVYHHRLNSLFIFSLYFILLTYKELEEIRLTTTLSIKWQNTQGYICNTIAC